jgi:hypothetical protein
MKTLMVEAGKLNYGGWKNCVRLTNGQIELVATTDVGPRIIRFGFVGGQNIFREYLEQVGKTGGEEWRIYGGHRLWQAPEDPQRTYASDNQPVTDSWDGRTLKLTQPVDATGIQKEIEVTMNPTENQVVVLHRLLNRNSSTVNLAPWALTCLAPEGRAIFPQERFRPHSDSSLVPTRVLALWSYTDMQDPRWNWGTRYIQLRQDPTASTPQKMGMTNTLGWAAYTVGDSLWLNRFAYDRRGRYPDFGSNCECFVDGTMLEIESLGPLQLLAPNNSAEHVEQWFLCRAKIRTQESEMDDDLAPFIQQTDLSQF